MPRVIFYRTSYHFLLYVMAPADPVDRSWEILQGKGAGDDGRRRVSFMFRLTFRAASATLILSYILFYVMATVTWANGLQGRPARPASMALSLARVVVLTSQVGRGKSEGALGMFFVSAALFCWSCAKLRAVG